MKIDLNNTIDLKIIISSYERVELPFFFILYSVRFNYSYRLKDLASGERILISSLSEYKHLSTERGFCVSFTISVTCLTGYFAI